MSRVPIIIEKPWNIPREQGRVYNKAHIEKDLKSINQAAGIHCYVRDSYKEKLIVDTDSSLILCGYPKLLAEKEGFNFYQRILHEDDWEWLVQMNVAGYEVFFSYSEQQRMSLLSIYDLSIKTINKGSLILHHRSSPYQLCKNGNLWLSMSCVSQSVQPKSGNAVIMNIATGDLYNFNGDKFVLSCTPVLTGDEMMILRWMTQEQSVQQMSKLMGVSVSSIRRKCNSLFKKLDVSSPVGAVHKAHLWGMEIL
jgi:DNA-binding CsgD family transcriptional regulator